MVVVWMLLGVSLLSLGWFIGINSIYTVTYLYPPKGQPFLQQEDGSYAQITERHEIKKHIGVPFGKDRDKSYFMFFDAWPDGLPSGQYEFPGGTFYINDTIYLGGK